MNLANALLNIFAMCIVLVMMLATMSFNKKDLRRKRLFFLCLILFFYIASDTMFELFRHQTDDLSIKILYISENLTILFTNFICFSWVKYAGETIWDDDYKDKWYTSLYFYVVVINTILVLINVFEPVVFRISEDGDFVFLPMCAVLSALNFLSIIVCAVSTFKNRDRLTKSTFTCLFIFPIFPAIAEVADMFSSPLDLRCLYAISILLIFNISQKETIDRDYLTGVYNRKYLDNKLSVWFSSAKGRMISGILIDVDGMRKINEKFGIKAGDQVLIDVAMLLDKVDKDLSPIRYGLDTFLLIWPSKNNIDIETKQEAINKLLDELNEDRQEEEKINLLLSGFEFRSTDFPTQYQLIKILDNRLFEVKKEMSYIIRKAVDEKLIEAYYQPIYSFKKERFTSCEALLRYTDPERGYIPADKFVAAAEKNGLISLVDEYMLNEVCKMISSEEFKNSGIEYVEVNLSAEQCKDPNLPQTMLNIVKKNGVSPSMINLELTETVFASSQKDLWKNLETLISYGFGISLDDFGSGYSNFERIGHIPINIVKFDKSFVAELSNFKVKKMYSGLIPILHDIKFKIVAEGVETLDALNEVQNMGVDFVQGWYFSKALPKKEFLEFIQKNKRDL